MLGISFPVALFIGLALLSDSLNGFRDGSSLVATAIASRALSSRYALVLTALGLALSYGANDGQKTMGVITLGLVVAGVLPASSPPMGHRALCDGDHRRNNDRYVAADPNVGWQTLQTRSSARIHNAGGGDWRYLDVGIARRASQYDAGGEHGDPGCRLGGASVQGALAGRGPNRPGLARDDSIQHRGGSCFCSHAEAMDVNDQVAIIALAAILVIRRPGWSPARLAEPR